jgi:Bacterial PH domain
MDRGKGPEKEEEVTPMRREFAIIPPDLRLAIPLLFLSLLAGLVGIGFAAREEPWAWLGAIVIVLMGAFIVWSIRRRHVVLEGELLTIAAGMNTARVRTADLDITAARIVNLADTSTLKPGLKTFGTSMPGFHAGHFRLRDRARAFVLLTDKTNVLSLPERNGRMLLLSLERPQALLDALRTMAEAGARR